MGQKCFYHCCFCYIIDIVDMLAGTYVSVLLCMSYMCSCTIVICLGVCLCSFIVVGGGGWKGHIHVVERRVVDECSVKYRNHGQPCRTHTP